MRPILNPVKKQFLLGLVAMSALSLRGTPIFLSGNFLTDDEVDLFQVTLNSPGTVTFQTTSYTGGGFDPYLSLFDGGGNLIAVNDDGDCAVVGQDPVTGNCFDSYLQQSLGAGTYTLALTEYYNVANGPTLGDGFSEAGQGDFTCPQGFCDSSPSQRTSAWALTITGADSVNGQTSSVPEPASWTLAAGALATISISRRKKIK
jgi:hypothetical protein